MSYNCQFSEVSFYRSTVLEIMATTENRGIGVRYRKFIKNSHSMVIEIYALTLSD